MRAGLLTVAVGCSLGLLTMWAVGFDPVAWWTNQRVTTSSAVAPITGGSRVNVAAAQPTPIGTDSSVAAHPRPLLLASTRLGKNAHEGYASIGVTAQSPQVYRSGAILANGTRITEVFSDHVVLERDGKRATLYLAGKEPAGYAPPDTDLLSVGGHVEYPASADSQDALTDVMRLTPIYEGSAMRGLEVYANPRSGSFAQLGLEPGDRITVIEGEPVVNFKAAIASLRRITEGSALQVSITRAGQPMSLSLDGSVVAIAKASGLNR